MLLLLFLLLLMVLLLLKFNFFRLFRPPELLRPPGSAHRLAFPVEEQGRLLREARPPRSAKGGRFQTLPRLWGHTPEFAGSLLRMGGGGHCAHSQEREEPGQVPQMRRRRHQEAGARAVNSGLPGIYSNNQIEFPNKFEFFPSDPWPHQGEDFASVPSAGGEDHRAGGGKGQQDI